MIFSIDASVWAPVIVLISPFVGDSVVAVCRRFRGRDKLVLYLIILQSLPDVSMDKSVSYFYGFFFIHLILLAQPDAI